MPFFYSLLEDYEALMFFWLSEIARSESSLRPEGPLPSEPEFGSTAALLAAAFLLSSKNAAPILVYVSLFSNVDFDLTLDLSSAIS